MDPPFVKNVEEQLMKGRVSRRKQGEVPYPVVYARDMLNFDNWDHMFLVSCCRSLTMHQFDSPPSNVLDLGCGGGFWAVEAAKQWKYSIITGFDVNAIQPSLSQFKNVYNDVSRRVKWVHGNLLDKLPFPAESFDFVRIVGIGLGVPEDEWQNVLEEVSRTMKPGAVLEVIEENLMFPTGSVDTGPVDDSVSSHTHSATSDTLIDCGNLGSDESHLVKASSSQTTLRDSLSSVPLTAHSKLSFSPPSSFDQFYPSRPVSHPLLNPQDHTKLKAAWEAMLSHRFLAPQLVTVLPFYLSSTFTDVRSHDTLHIPLPSNSHSHRTKNARDSSTSRLEPEISFRMRSSSRSVGEGSVGSSTATLQTISSWAPMHLAKTMRTVVACKESIWVEYEKLFGNNPTVPPVTRTLSRTAGGSQIMAQPSVREDFETEWSNWELDMTDRINMRKLMASEFKWDEPSGEPPDWRIWRSGTTSQGSSTTDETTTSLCRSLRGFVCWKPS